MKVQILVTLLLTISYHHNIRYLKQPTPSRTSSTVKPIILQPIPSIKINVRYVKPSPILNLMEELGQIIAKNNKNPPDDVKQKPFYCSQHNTTSSLTIQNDSVRERLVATNYGFNMYVDSKDLSVSKVIEGSGTWEPEYIQLIANIVKKGQNVLNLGSQSGLQALVMGKIIGPTGKLFIFEPYSFSNKLVTSNIKLNNLTNITTIYKVAASDEIRNSSILVGYWNTGGSSVVPNVDVDKKNYGADQVEIVATNLVDNLLPADVSLDFALIDVEKMEVKALRGMKNIIERSPHLVMMVEWQYGLNSESNKTQTVELLSFLYNKGYRIYTYMGGDSKKCKLGQFVEQSRIQRILKTKFADFFFFPPAVPLPS